MNFVSILFMFSIFHKTRQKYNGYHGVGYGVLELLMKAKLLIVTTEITVEDKTVIVATTHIYQGVAAS